MTLRELYRAGRERLLQAGIESASFDARLLLEHHALLPRYVDVADGEKPAPDAMILAFQKDIERRALHTPLQYLLGKWEFLGLPFAVGDGVLIPRPETELLCETAAALTASIPSPVCLDLCSGSGCVAIGVAHLCPGAQVTAVERSQEAFEYLTRNIAQNDCGERVSPICADLFAYADAVQDAAFDLITANPPYLTDADMQALQPEVQREPAMALAGGGDGLYFYRGIVPLYLSKLAPGGFFAFEVGIGQADAVAGILEDCGLSNTTARTDLGGIARVVCGQKMRA